MTAEIPVHLPPSVEECAEALFDYDAEPGEYEPSYYTWSDGIPFVFDGARRTFRRQVAERQLE